MVRDEGKKIQELKNMFEIRFSLRNTKERHDKDKGTVFLYPQLKGQQIRARKAERSYTGGKTFSVTKQRATTTAWACCGPFVHGEYAGQAC